MHSSNKSPSLKDNAFFGKRAAEFFGKRAPSELFGKRNMEFFGKRSSIDALENKRGGEVFFGKRAASLDYDDLDELLRA